jgi:RNA-directed DNA polymerase
VRYADDFVVMCRRRKACEEAQAASSTCWVGLGLEAASAEDATRGADFDGREGFDFLGCHLHKRMSGWQQEGVRRYYLHRWPSRKAMNRVRAG